VHERTRLPRRGRIVARALVLGVLWGAAPGVAYLVALTLGSAVLSPSSGQLDVPLMVVGAPIAAIVGAVIGGVLALIAGIVLVVSGPVVLADRPRTRLISAGSAAAIPLCLMFVSLGISAIGGWAWWLSVAVLAAAAGAALGPRVIHGKGQRTARRAICRRGRIRTPDEMAA